MNYLRRISTLRLLAIGAALTLFAAATAAIALAATGGGPTPPPKPLAEAVHDALSAPPLEGVTARVHFTDNLIGESVLEGSDPLLGGASGRLWASADGRLRLELQADVSKSSGGDFQVLVDKRSFTVYDPGTETAYEGTLPQREKAGEGEAGKDEAPSLARVQEGIEEAMKHADLSGAIPSDVAGQRRLHAARLAEGERRPRRRRRARLGRRQRGAAARRRLREGRKLAGARAERDRNLLRAGRRIGLRSLASARGEGRQPEPAGRRRGQGERRLRSGHRAGSRPGEDLVRAQRPAEPRRHGPRPGAADLQRRRRRRAAHLRRRPRRDRRARAAGRRSRIGRRRRNGRAAAPERDDRRGDARPSSWKRRSAR